MLGAIILGIIQGLAEFLPISSTAHLILVPWFFHWEGLLDSLAFDVALHAGTLFSILICFWRDILEMFTKRFRMVLLIGLATIPAGLAGVLLKDRIEGAFRTPELIALMLIVFGVVMYIAERAKKKKKMTDVGVLGAIFIGCAQAVALIPGVSRSGITISAGLGAGLKREEAARFSFLLSIPVIAGAVLLEGRAMLKSPEHFDFTLIGAGFLTSAITGIIAIKFLLGYLKKHTMNVFVIYRFILAGMILGWVWFGA